MSEVPRGIPARFGRQLTGTAAAQVLALALGAIVLPLAARHWSPGVFGRYVISYRLLALVQPALTLSANVSVTRYIARLRSSDQSVAISVIVGAAAILIVPVGGAGVLLLVFSNPISRLVFGVGGTADLVRAFAALLVGSTVSTVVISALQGMFRIALANVLAIIYIGIAPLASLALFSTPGGVLLCTAAIWLIASLVFILPMLATPHADIAKASAIALFRFGIRRVPGELAAFGLLTVPAILAASTGGVVYGGFVSLGMSMVTLAGAICAPLSTVMLPHMSAEFAGDAGGRLKLVRLLLVAVNMVVLFGTLIVFALMPNLLNVAFGHAYVAATDTMRVACFAIPAYCAYVTVRSAVDAYHERAVTMRYALIGFAAFTVAYACLRAAGAPLPELLAFDLGIWVLAGLTLRRSISLLQAPGTVGGRAPLSRSR